MQGIFGAKKNKDAQASISDASDSIYKKGDSIDEKIKRLDAELVRYKEQIKKTRPGTAQETIKARAIRLIKQKKVYESQRDMLYSQSFKLDKVSFAADEFKDAQQTRSRGDSSKQSKMNFFWTCS